MLVASQLGELNTLDVLFSFSKAHATLLPYEQDLERGFLIYFQFLLHPATHETQNMTYILIYFAVSIEKH